MKQMHKVENLGQLRKVKKCHLHLNHDLKLHLFLELGILNDFKNQELGIPFLSSVEFWHSRRSSGLKCIVNGSGLKSTSLINLTRFCLMLPPPHSTASSVLLQKANSPAKDSFLTTVNEILTFLSGSLKRNVNYLLEYGGSLLN